MPRPSDALVLVDPQVDFFPGGALAVPGAEVTLEPIHAALKAFRELGLEIVVTRDWHPADHCSFSSRGGPWPVHCVAGTPGAAFHPDLRLPPVVTLVSKATDPEREAYSDFDGTGLDRLLERRGITRLVVGGLALDYCVRATCLDGREAGFDVVLLAPATRAVEVHPGDGERALGELVAAGVIVADSVP